LQCKPSFLNIFFIILIKRIYKRLRRGFAESEFYAFFQKWLKLNRWAIFLYIIICAGATIFYVGNVRTVNSILTDNIQLEKKLDDLRTSNKALRSEVIKLESPDRIIPLVETELGMIKNPGAPRNLNYNIEK